MQAATAVQDRNVSAAVRSAPAPRDPLDLLEQFGTTITIERDRQIHGQGDDADTCYRVLRGCVRVVNLLEDGRRQIGEFLLPGDLLGFDVFGTHDFAAEAVTEVVLRRYPRRMVEALAEKQLGLSRWLRDVVATNLRTAHARLLMLGRKTASERLAGFLLEMSKRLARKGEWMELPMSRTDVADHLGLTIETVCRLLAHLRREKTVDIGRGSIRITDMVALGQMALEARH
jgi:CRP/FNR family transcriptional regulator, nitrogen fixation regulation protein